MLESIVIDAVQDRADDLRNARDPEDILAEIADEAVPTYTHERVELWALEGYPSPELNDSNDILVLITYAIYERAYEYAVAEFHSLEAEWADENYDEEKEDA